MKRLNKKVVTKDKWIWMPHPAHFICSYDCKFFLATKVGKYIISTVGEYFPDAPIREIFAESRKVILEGRGDARRNDYMQKIGFEELGVGRLYETMVFKSQKMSKDGCGACLYRMKTPSDIDFDGYKTAKEAYRGHMKMCLKWSKK